MKRKAEMEEGSLFSQTDMTPKGSKDTKTAQPCRRSGRPRLEGKNLGV